MTRSYWYALAAAATFGISVPLSKLLLRDVEPLVLAALLYLGAGAVLGVVGVARGTVLKQSVPAQPPLHRADWPWLLAAIGLGGVAAPVVLLLGLNRTGAGTASLLLSLETPFTVIIAGVLFSEPLGWRLSLGALVVTAAGALLAAHDSSGWRFSVGALAVVAAPLCWAADNNLTRKVSLTDPVAIVRWKGLAAGAVNALLAVALGVSWPSWEFVLASLALGAVSYGVSLAFFVLALRGLGAARTSSLFGAAPFLGVALAAAIFVESRSWVLAPAAAGVALGTWLLLGERHGHWHEHAPLVHEHRHYHDVHHQHRHDADYGPEPHSHVHEHGPLAHSHVHVPDAHHRHPHPRRALQGR